MIGTCSKCKEKCLVLNLPVLRYGVRPKQVSGCCGAPLVDPEGPERDEIETPGEHVEEVTENKDVCSNCKRECEVYIDVDITSKLPTVRTLSKCCSSRIDTLETPSGRLPYRGPR